MKALTSSLRWRLYLIYILLMIGIFSVSGVFIFTKIQDRLINNRSAQIYECISWALTGEENSDRLRVSDLNQVNESLLDAPSPDFSFFLLDINGELIYPLGQGKPEFIEISLSDNEIPRISLSGEEIKSIGKVSGDRYRTLTIIWPLSDTSDSLIGAIQGEVRLDEADNTLANLTITLVVGFLFLFVLGSILWLLLIRKVIQPLVDIARISKNISTGNLEKRIAVPKIRDEVYYTALAFNQMLDSLQAHISREKKLKSKMQQFLSDASHELRTPLTVMRGYVDVLRHGLKDDPKTLNDALEAMHTTLGKMTRLTSDLLNLSQLDLGKQLNIEDVELNHLCQSVVDMAQVIAKGRQLKFQPGPEAVIRGDVDVLEHALWNLLDNSVRHTAPDGIITISVNCQEQDAHIIVEDNGVGIHADHLNRIFDRFYQVDPKQPGGSGLGLAIVKAIVEAHQGEVNISSSLGYGTTVTISLPLT